MGKKAKAEVVRCKPNAGGRPPALKAQDIVVLRLIIAQMPHASCRNSPLSSSGVAQ